MLLKNDFRYHFLPCIFKFNVLICMDDTEKTFPDH